MSASLCFYLGFYHPLIKFGTAMGQEFDGISIVAFGFHSDGHIVVIKHARHDIIVLGHLSVMGQSRNVVHQNGGNLPNQKPHAKANGCQLC